MTICTLCTDENLCAQCATDASRDGKSFKEVQAERCAALEALQSSVPGGRVMFFKWRAEKKGDHWWIDLFSGTNPGSLAKCGGICMRDEEWLRFKLVLLGGDELRGDQIGAATFIEEREDDDAFQFVSPATELVDARTGYVRGWKRPHRTPKGDGDGPVSG